MLELRELEKQNYEAADHNKTKQLRRVQAKLTAEQHRLVS